MKIIVFIMVFCVLLFGEYEKAKIDMHGGKSYNQYGSTKDSFKKKRMGFSALLDNNSSKKSLKKPQK